MKKNIVSAIVTEVDIVSLTEVKQEVKIHTKINHIVKESRKDRRERILKKVLNNKFLNKTLTFTEINNIVKKAEPKFDMNHHTTSELYDLLCSKFCYIPIKSWNCGIWLEFDCDMTDLDIKYPWDYNQSLFNNLMNRPIIIKEIL